MAEVRREVPCLFCLSDRSAIVERVVPRNVLLLSQTLNHKMPNVRLTSKKSPSVRYHRAPRNSPPCRWRKVPARRGDTTEQPGEGLPCRRRRRCCCAATASAATAAAHALADEAHRRSPSNSAMVCRALRHANKNAAFSVTASSDEESRSAAASPAPAKTKDRASAAAEDRVVR